MRIKKRARNEKRAKEKAVKVKVSKPMDYLKNVV